MRIAMILGTNMTMMATTTKITPTVANYDDNDGYDYDVSVYVYVYQISKASIVTMNTTKGHTERGSPKSGPEDFYILVFFYFVAFHFDHPHDGEESISLLTNNCTNQEKLARLTSRARWSASHAGDVPLETDVM